MKRTESVAPPSAAAAPCEPGAPIVVRVDDEPSDGSSEALTRIARGVVAQEVARATNVTARAAGSRDGECGVALSVSVDPVARPADRQLRVGVALAVVREPAHAEVAVLRFAYTQPSVDEKDEQTERRLVARASSAATRSVVRSIRRYVEGQDTCGAPRCEGEATPELRKELTARALRSHHCYDLALAREATLRGRVELDVRVDGTGRTCGVVVAQHDPGMNDVAECAADYFLEDFPTTPGSCVQATVPINFLPLAR